MGNNGHTGAPPAQRTPEETLQAFCTALAQLVTQAERSGVILTVERRPRVPLAMGNHGAFVEGRFSLAFLRACDEAAQRHAERSRIVLQ